MVICMWTMDNGHLYVDYGYNGHLYGHIMVICMWTMDNGHLYVDYG